VSTVAEWIAAVVRWAKHAVVCGDSAWIISKHEARLFSCDQAVALLRSRRAPGRVERRG
jgi:hypothetical protein